MKKKPTKKQLLERAGLVPEPVPAHVARVMGSRDELVMEKLTPKALKARAVEVVEETERRIRSNYDHRLREIQNRAASELGKQEALTKQNDFLGAQLRIADAEMGRLKKQATDLEKKLTHALGLGKKLLVAVEAIADEAAFSEARTKARNAVDSIDRLDLRAIRDFAS